MKKNLLIFLFLILFSAFAKHAFSQYEVPKLDGKWWLIAASPDLGPYNKPGQEAVDFTIYQSKDGKWHCVSCIRYTNYPGATRLFYRWEADSLTQSPWTPKGIFWTTGTVGAPDALGFQMGVNTPYTVEGRLQAPHCIQYDGKYYMFHNNGGAFCLISDDGRNWTQWKDHKGSAMFFEMGRDVMVFNDLASSGKWYACFLANKPGKGVGAIMTARVAENLQGPWSSDIIPIHTEGNPESPFMIKKENKYYLWEQMYVYMNDKPYEFPSEPIIHLGSGATCERYAPEIIEHKGEYYIAGYTLAKGLAGIYMSKLKWVDPSDPSLDGYASNITIAEATFYPEFAPSKTHYYLTVPNSVNDLTINVSKKDTVTVNLFRNKNLPEANHEVRVALNATDKKTSRVYIFNVFRIPASASTYSLTVNNGYQSGIYASGQKVPIIAKIPPGKVFDKWTGDISGIAEPTKAHTTLTMPAAELTITATFKDPVK